MNPRLSDLLKYTTVVGSPSSDGLESEDVKEKLQFEFESEDPGSQVGPHLICGFQAEEPVTKELQPKEQNLSAAFGSLNYVNEI